MWEDPDIRAALGVLVAQGLVAIAMAGYSEDTKVIYHRSRAKAKMRSSRG